MLSRFRTPAAFALLSITMVACGSPSDADLTPPRTITGTITVPSAQAASPVLIGDFDAVQSSSFDVIDATRDERRPSTTSVASTTYHA